MQNQNITDTTKIRQIWIDGEHVFDAKIENENALERENTMNNEGLIFIPEHLSGWKTMQIETKNRKEESNERDRFRNRKNRKIAKNICNTKYNIIGSKCII